MICPNLRRNYLANCVMHCIFRSRTGTLVAACMLLALGFVGLAWVSVEAGNVRSMLLLACAITCGYIYQVLNIPAGAG